MSANGHILTPGDGSPLAFQRRSIHNRYNALGQDVGVVSGQMAQLAQVVEMTTSTLRPLFQTGWRGVLIRGMWLFTGRYPQSLVLALDRQPSESANSRAAMDSGE